MKDPEEKDINQTAKSIVDYISNDDSQKNPAAVALGRLGGIKGGPARARKLTSAQRKEIARSAALKRWSKNK